MNEFICPNGRMSVNGVCPIFEGDDGQVKDFKDNEKGIFEFDFEKPTKAAFEKADNIITNRFKNWICCNKLSIWIWIRRSFSSICSTSCYRWFFKK